MPDLNDLETVLEVRKRSEDWWLNFLCFAKKRPGWFFLLGMLTTVLVSLPWVGFILVVQNIILEPMDVDRRLMMLVAIIVSLPLVPLFHISFFLTIGAYFRILGMGNWFGRNPTGFVDELIEASKYRSRALSRNFEKRWISVHNFLVWYFVLGLLAILVFPILNGTLSQIDSDIGRWLALSAVVVVSVVCARWLVKPIKVTTTLGIR